MKSRARDTGKPARKSVKAMALPEVAEKVMKRSYQRSGRVAGGTLLSSGAKQTTANFQNSASEPQIIRTPGGEELVVLPRAEYEALLECADREGEDVEDVAIYDARKAELAAGGAVLPPEVCAAILHGDTRLKAIRNWRGETQLHLNSKTGIAQGYLSDLENGRRTGTPETIAKIAQALNVPVEWLS